jgi:hypothetical protein
MSVLGRAFGDHTRRVHSSGIPNTESVLGEFASRVAGYADRELAENRGGLNRSN